MGRDGGLVGEGKMVAIGADVADGAVKLRLSPVTEIKLPAEPSRNPKPNSYAGFVRYASPPHAGTYRVTLSEPGWIDVVQDGREMESGAFSAVTGCEGIRKSVKFHLSPSPFAVEFTGGPVKVIP